MSLRSLLLCFVAFTFVFGDVPSNRFIQTPDGPAPQPTVRNVDVRPISVTPSHLSTPIIIDSTTNVTDSEVGNMEYFRQKYTELRGRFDDWLKDPNHPEHRQIIFPAILGAIVGVSLLLLCLFTRCVCKLTKLTVLAVLLISLLAAVVFYLKNNK